MHLIFCSTTTLKLYASRKSTKFWHALILKKLVIFHVVIYSSADRFSFPVFNAIIRVLGLICDGIIIGRFFLGKVVSPTLNPQPEVSNHPNHLRSILWFNY